MRTLRRFLARFTSLFTRNRADAEFSAEIEAHLALMQEDFERRGMSPAEARREARLKLGGVEQTTEVYRQTRTLHWLETLVQDVRFALRMLRKNPGFAAIAILTLALGIGANTAIFSVVNSVLLRPLPYREASRLVWVGDYIHNGRESLISDAEYFSWRKYCTAFQEITDYQTREFTLTGAGDAERISATRASYSFLRTLSVAPQLGRDISPSEDVPNGPRVALISDSLWRGRFSKDPAIVGSTITLDGNLYVVIGVLPAGFEFPGNPRSELLIPFQISDQQIARGRIDMFVQVIARLRPGVSAEAAAADAQVIAKAAHADLPDGIIKGMLKDSRVAAMPLHDFLVGNVRQALLLLFGAVGFVLLIACANVASLQLARAAAREREIVMRRALGAGRWRIARQLLTECALTGLAGGLAGIALGVWLVALVRRLGPKDIPHLSVTQLDGRVLAFTLVVSVAAGILFGLAPVLSTFRLALNDSLKQGGAQGSAGKRVVRPQQVLVTMELGMALVLLIGAGLLARSFARLISVPIGFNSHGVLTGRIDLPTKAYLKDEQKREFYSQLLNRVQALPGVEVASGGAELPFGGFVMVTVVQQVEGHPKLETAPGGPWTAAVDYVAPGYFEALRIPLKAGRFLDRRDGPAAPQAIVVNETFARTYFPNENAIGHRVRSGSDDSYNTIVGVVADTPQAGIAAKVESEMYLSAEQAPYGMMDLAIRTAGDPTTLVPAVRQAVADVDRSVPLYEVATLDETISDQVASQRFSLSLLGAFAGLALLLASVGIYGVTAYAVGQRTRELGIRVALGAQWSDIRNLVLGQAVRLVIAGVAFGLAGAFALTRLLRAMLFNVQPNDPLIFAWAALAMFVVMMAASYLPARRAMRVDPASTTRCE